LRRQSTSPPTIISGDLDFCLWIHDASAQQTTLWRSDQGKHLWIHDANIAGPRLLSFLLEIS
jgi:hypothetical protein